MFLSPLPKCQYCGSKMISLFYSCFVALIQVELWLHQLKIVTFFFLFS